MPITMEEDFNSREWFTSDVQEHDRFYTLMGSSNDIDIRTHVENNTSSQIDLAIRQTIEVRAEWADTSTDTGLWRAVVHYGPLDLSESVFSFNTTGSTQHIKQSLRTLSQYVVPGNTQPQHQGAINVQDGSVEGVDIVVPVYNFSETHFKTDAFVDSAYKNTLFTLTGRINTQAFKGFAIKEVLFLGVQGSKRGSAEWELNYQFAALPHRTNISIGGIATIPVKFGWDLLWVQYREAVESVDDSSALSRQPHAAYLEQVYEEGDLTDLDIGV